MVYRDLSDHWSHCLNVHRETFVIGFWIIGLYLPLIYCFLFGALISPTIPSGLGILIDVPRAEITEIRTSGESLFNDGVGVDVFLILFSLATKGDVALLGSGQLFMLEAVGGGMLGLGLGSVAYQTLKPVNAHQAELLITLALVMVFTG